MNQDPGRKFRTSRGYQMEHLRESGLSEAMEDYLEMVSRLCEQSGYTRVGRLSERLQVKPSSASKMVSKLVKLGYLRYDHNDSIQLTALGREVSGYLLDRHRTVERFLRFLGNPDPLRETEMLEHSLSRSTVEQIRKLLAFMRRSPDTAAQLERFLREAPVDPPGQRPQAVRAAKSD